MADAAPQSFGKALQLLVTTQERNLDIAKRWSESVLGLLREQAEGNRAVLETLGSSLTAMERTLASQEETNRALRASLEAYREIVERAAGTQEQSIELVQTTMTALVQGLQGQLEAAMALLAAAPDPSAEWGGDLVRQWMGAYRDLLEAYRPPPRRGQGRRG